MVITHPGKPIRRNHSCAYPQRMLWVDTETRQQTNGRETRHTFLMGWTRYVVQGDISHTQHDSWRFWKDPKDLCLYLQSRVTDKKALYVFGHNIFFDLQVCHFFYWFPRWGWQLGFMYDEGLTYILVIKKDKRTIKVVSTTNYFAQNLKTLGDNLGLAKLDVSFGKSSYSELKTYCRRDTEICSESVFEYMRFNRLHDTGKFSMTRASQSMAAYRHRFMTDTIYHHDYEEITELERLAYFGGRTEAFHFGRVPGNDFVFLDVNSMYPYVMQRYRYPTRLMYYLNTPSWDEVAARLKTTCVVAEVKLSTDVPMYAKRSNGKVIFPIGNFWTYLCTEGLRRALDNGHLREISRIAIYEPAYVFRDYVDYFYPLKARYKEEGNQIYTSMVKLYLNSLYGKFGERHDIEEIIDEPHITDPYRMESYDFTTGERIVESHLFGKTIRRYGKMEGPRSVPAIPAHVTEYARMYLWDIISEIGTRNVFYCDTDSVAIHRDCVHRVQKRMDKGKLGYLDIDKQARTLVINGAKDYELDGNRRTKGVPKSAECIAPNTFRYDQFLGSISHLRQGETKAFVTHEVIKHAVPKYDKGVIQSNGDICPIVLDEG